MTEKLQIYKCSNCGNLVQVILPGVGELVCCGEPMKLQIPKHEDSKTGDIHKPIINKDSKHIVVEVLNHPMLEEHYIEFIQVYKNDGSEIYLKYLEPGELAQFDINDINSNVSAIECCNLHGLWGNNNDKY